MRGSRRLAALVAALVCGLVVASLTASPATATAREAPAHAPINGSGSSWSANAVNQWIADVDQNGMQVVFTASGSAQGRKDFAFNTTDFGVTEIGFQGFDPVTGESDTPGDRAFAYLPIVSGGTSFPYQIRVRGQLVRDLRLSGRTLVKIFTNQITNWADPEITADNNGRVLPSLPIIPVVHSEGSGSSAHLTDYFDKEFPDLWRPFLGRGGLTEYYPRKGAAIAQTGSDGVINFVTSAAANGAIGYDEFSYALMKNWPVAKLGNAAGYFALPSQYNVAVALTRANINQDRNSPDFLLQELSDVYKFNDPRTYPLSSYSYMLLATGANDKKMTSEKRQTVADFVYYGICEGQQEMGPIGYSSLPVNLVQAGFEQVAKLKAADPEVDLAQRDVASCHNPTFVAGDPSRNYLAEIAPMPPACDKAGQGPCADAALGPGVGAGQGSGGKSGASKGAAGATKAGAGGKGAAGTGAAATGTAEAEAAAAAAAAAAETAAEEATDEESEAEAEQLAAAGGSGARGGGTGAAVPGALVPLALALVAFVVAAPPLLYRRFSRDPGEPT